jgi:N-acetylglucosaminyldiphosphoundecaprenol N-acetyl-beta-D-mannosaminyltransferase
MFTVDQCVERHIALFDTFSRRRRHAFGLPFTSLTAGDVAAYVADDSPAGRVRLVVTPNVDHIRLLRRPEFAAAYAAAEIVCPDGVPVAAYAWAMGLSPPHRVTGCEILHALMARSDLNHHRVFVVAESVRTAEALERWAARRELFGNLRAVVAPPNLLEGQDAQLALAQAAREFCATIMIVTLGAPVSEIFVHRQREALPPCWALCVGQAVRVELGLAARAPVLMRKIAMEWLWRVCCEPRRLSSRYLKSAVWFPYAVARDLLRRPELGTRLQSVIAPANDKWTGQAAKTGGWAGSDALNTPNTGNPVA